MEEGHAIIIAVATLGFTALGAYTRTLMREIEKLRDREAPSRREHDSLVSEVNRVAMRQMQIGTELADLRRGTHHDDREQDGG